MPTKDHAPERRPMFVRLDEADHAALEALAAADGTDKSTVARRLIRAGLRQEQMAGTIPGPATKPVRPTRRRKE